MLPCVMLYATIGATLQGVIVRRGAGWQCVQRFGVECVCAGGRAL